MVTGRDAATGGGNLRDLLAGNERYVFTLIQKFSTAYRETMPVLSDRDDIIVITDEAHRSQYDQLAANMRAALPNAAFIGFIGTPLIKGEDSPTREVFGDYVSIYDFAQSVADGATVPLYYEARKPELQLNADDLREEMDALLDAAALNEEQEAKLNQQFGRQYRLITNNDRLDKVADDLVRHFAARGYRGKAMFVAIDKATAVRMHDKTAGVIVDYVGVFQNLQKALAIYAGGGGGPAARAARSRTRWRSSWRWSVSWRSRVCLRTALASILTQSRRRLPLDLCVSA